MGIEYDYKPNSHKSKQEQNELVKDKKVDKVVKGTVKTKKKKGTSIKDVFISEDAKNVKSYVFMDVLVPAVKKAISDIVSKLPSNDKIIMVDVTEILDSGLTGVVAIKIAEQFNKPCILLKKH